MKEPTELIKELENNLDYYTSMKDYTLIDLSFQNELKACFPDISNKREDYTEELEENCFFKNVPKDFIAKISLSELNRMYQNNTELTLSSDDGELQAVQPFFKHKDFQITYERIIIGEEKRTMVVIRNIPFQYSPRTLFEELCVNFYGKFNYFYMPYNSQLKKNNGYALVNFINPFHVISFYDKYQKNKFNKYINERKLYISYSKFVFEGQTEADATTAKDIQIPLRYLKFFKRIYNHSVCIIKERNYQNDGYFTVKSIGKKIIL